MPGKTKDVLFPGQSVLTMVARLKGLFARDRKTVDMTEGDIKRHLIYFAFPLLVGNIFQQLYNMVDTWVVGNYVSNEAFSAVGSVGPIIFMIIGFFFGFSSGAGVVISQYYGAKRYDKVQDTVHTIMVMTIIFSIVMTVAGVALTPFMLDMMNTPESVVKEARTYLYIYFGGSSGLLIYNMGSSIMRAVGDSNRPFYYLVISACTNIVLDLVFVLVFGMGVDGVAYATIIAQGISAVLVLIELFKTDRCIKVSIKKLKIDKEMMMKTIKIGLPSGVQMTITSFSNVFVQSYINYFGEDFMSGWTAYSKIDQLIFLPMQSLSLAATTFVGQNLGIHNVKRAKQGTNTALMISVVSTVILMIPVIIFAPSLIAFFNSKAEVVNYGTILLRYLTPFYILCCANQIYAGALRGAGNTRATMIIMLATFVGFRQLYLFVVANFISNEIIPIAMSYPAGWLMCSIASTVYYYKVGLSSKVIQKDESSERPAVGQKA